MTNTPLVIRTSYGCSDPELHHLLTAGVIGGGASYDPDAQSWFGRVTAAGSSVTPAGYTDADAKATHSQLFASVKSIVGWDNVREFYITGAVANVAASLVKAKDGTGGVKPSLSVVGAAPTLTPSGLDIGLRGNGTTTRLESGYILPNNDVSLVVLRSRYTAATVDNGGGVFASSPITGNLRLQVGASAGVVTSNEFQPARGPSAVVGIDFAGATAMRAYIHGQPQWQTAGLTSAFTAGELKPFGNQILNGQYYYTGIGAALMIACAHLTDQQHSDLAVAMETWGNFFGLGHENAMTFMGDSITKGQSPTSEFDRWTRGVATAKGLYERNLGCPDSRVRSDISIARSIHNRRFQTQVFPTNYVVLAPGANDVMNDATSAPNTADFRSKVNDIADAAISAVSGDPTKVILCTVAWLNTTTASATRLERLDTYNAEIRACATAKGILLCDTYAAFSAGGGNALMTDIVHPNTDGHALWRETALALIP